MGHKATVLSSINLEMAINVIRNPSRFVDYGDGVISEILFSFMLYAWHALNT